MQSNELKKRACFFGGMKHCGKSTHGKLFAKKKNIPFADLDDLIEALFHSDTGEKASCREIYSEKGLFFFQQLETKALKNWIKEHDQIQAVLSLGGGIASNKEAICLVKQTGYFIYLKLPKDILFNRIKYKGLPPFLQTKNPQESFSQLYNKRTAIYEKIADITITLGDKPKNETALIIRKKIDSFLKDSKNKKNQALNQEAVLNKQGEKNGWK